MRWWEWGIIAGIVYLVGIFTTTYLIARHFYESYPDASDWSPSGLDLSAVLLWPIALLIGVVLVEPEMLAKRMVRRARDQQKAVESGDEPFAKVKL